MNAKWKFYGLLSASFGGRKPYKLCRIKFNFSVKIIFGRNPDAAPLSDFFNIKCFMGFFYFKVGFEQLFSSLTSNSTGRTIIERKINFPFLPHLSTLKTRV